MPDRLISLARSHGLFILIASMLTIFAFIRVASIPFHPDESTQLYMSQDVELLLSNPAALAWTPDNAGGLHLHYRLVDAPLTRYLLGLSRLLAAKPAPSVDWDWSLSWEQNQRAGAVPEMELLTTGRTFLILLFPLDLLLLYAIGIQMQGRLTGLLAVILFGLNALVLLHTRRAMAEAALCFGVLLAMWSFLHGQRYPWLAGLGVAIALNAKQTLIGLVPAGLLGVSYLEPGTPAGRRVSRLASNWAQYLLVMIAATFLLNPALWKDPVGAAQAAWNARQELTGRQVADFQRLSPQVSIDSPARKIAAILANLYFVPPSFAETANYQAHTQPAEITYAANPLYNLMRGLLFGGILLILTLAGMILSIINLRRISNERQRAVSIVLFATFLVGISIYFLIPLPWQRYVMPLVPFVSLWASYCLASFTTRVRWRETAEISSRN